MARRGRTPTPEEAELLTVYLDAERYLLGSVAREVRDVADVAAAGEDVDARRAAGARRIREDAESVVRGLERGAPARMEQIMSAAADQGVDEATRQLNAATGGAGQYGDTINRGALNRLAATVVADAGDAHLSILRTVPDAYRTAVARTVSATLTGAETTRTAAQRALWSLTDQGITGFTDRAGRRWRLSSYVEMATRAAAARAMVDAQVDRLRAAGHDYVQADAVARCCELCRPWQGAILAASAGAPVGNVEVPSWLDDRPVSITVAGTLDDARSAGFMHPNCRHAVSVYLAGVTPDQPRAPRDDPDRYRAGQRQREIERGIRRWKERALTAVDDGHRVYAERAVRGWQGRMREHLDAHPYLMRRRYREQIGAGNNPTTGLRERVGRDGPTPQLVRGRARTPRQMTTPELHRKMNRSLVDEDYDLFDALAVESDRREAANAASAARQRARRAAEQERRGDELERLLAAGVDEDQAVADAYGKTLRQVRIERAKAELQGNGYRGDRFEDMARDAYYDHVEQRFADAQDATNGYMLTREATARGVNPRDLFVGPESRARANASPELREWFDQHGRPTLDEFTAELLDEGGAARQMRSGRGDFLS